MVPILTYKLGYSATSVSRTLRVPLQRSHQLCVEMVRCTGVAWESCKLTAVLAVDSVDNITWQLD